MGKKGYKMLKKKEREELLKEIVESLKKEGLTKADLLHLCDEYEGENYIAECRSMITATDWEIIGIGYNETENKALVTVNVTFDDNALNALQTCLEDLEQDLNT